MSTNQGADLTRTQPASIGSEIARARPLGAVVYRADYAEIARRFFMLKGASATNKDLAELLSVDENTITNWIAQHDEFAAAVFRGRAEADFEVVNAFHQRAIGCKTVTQKAFLDRTSGEPVIVEVVEEHPPDARAAAFWLRNRHPDAWKERTEHEVGPLADGDAGITREMPSEEAGARYAAFMRGEVIEGKAEEEEAT